MVVADTKGDLLSYPKTILQLPFLDDDSTANYRNDYMLACGEGMAGASKVCTAPLVDGSAGWPELLQGTCMRGPAKAWHMRLGWAGQGKEATGKGTHQCCQPSTRAAHLQPTPCRMWPTTSAPRRTAL